MGQKIHPLGFRLGITKEHRSKWFATKGSYSRLVLEDKKLREYFFQNYSNASIVDIQISRRQTTIDLETKESIDVMEISVYAAMPTKIVGRSVSKPSNKFTVSDLKTKLELLCNPERVKQNLPPLSIHLKLFQKKIPFSSASVIADSLILQLEDRKPFRSALRNSLKLTNRANLKGIKIQISGRLNGAEIARSEWVRKGRVPLQTLRANLDYSAKTAKTIYGILGIKVWTFQSDKD